MPSLVDQLQELLTQHEHAADHIRGTIALISGNGHNGTGNGNGHAAGAELVGKTRKPKRTPKRKAPLVGMDAAAKLALFTRKTPVSADDLHKAGVTNVGQFGIGVLVRHGYLKARRGGWVRTLKLHPSERATP